MDAETELRPDVRLVPCDDQLYVCASTGTLRVPVQLPAPADNTDTASDTHTGTNTGTDTNTDTNADLDTGTVRAATVPAAAVPDAVVKGLRSRGLAYDSGRFVHPLYGELSLGGDRAVAVAPQALGDALGALLGRAGVRTVPDGESERAAVAVLPLSLPEELLVRRAEAALKGGTPLVVYLSTPTRLLFATLTPPDTPCPMCLVRRLRANHTWQAIAGLPLDILFGAAHGDGCPSTAVAAGLLAHEVLVLLGDTPRPAPGTPVAADDGAPRHPTHTFLTELTHGSLRRTEHRLFHLPGCPVCADHVTPLANDDEAVQRDDAASWERMRDAVDPLTGMVPQLRVDECDSDLGGATYARTAGMTKTSWFSPVTAEARGGAVKSDPVTARVCAVGETLERYAAGVYDPRRLVRASFTELGKDAVDPRTLPLGSAAEYARHGRLATCDPDVRIDWVPGRSLATGDVRHVPACAVYLPYRFPPGHRAWYDPISTGLAAGSGYHHAAHGGLMEAVERDATVLFWENRLTLPSLDLDTLPEGPARRIVARMRDQGVSVTAKDLTTDLGIPVVGVRFLRHTKRRPVVTHAARADLDPHAALLGALEEGCLGWAGARLWQEHLDGGESIPGPDDVLTSLKEFSLYYWSPDRVRHLGFWDEGAVREVPAARAPGGFRADVAEAARRLAAQGYEAVAVDITPIDVAECGVTVVRTVAPGLCPITLRSDFHRRGGPRVFDAPVAMGVRSTPLTEAQLNPLPLPFL